MTAPLLAEQLRGQRLLPGAAHLVLLAVVAFLVRDVLPPQVFLPWAAAIAIVVALRVVLWGKFIRPDASPRIVAWTVRLTMLSLGLAWGVGTALFGGSIPPVTVSLLLLGLAGLLAGGLTTLLGDRNAYALYAAAMFVPIMAGMAVWGEGHLNDVGIVLVAIFLGFTIRLHAQAHAMLLQRVQTERQLASAQAIAHVGSWEWDIPGNVVTWSDELRRMYGLAPDAPAGYAEFLAIAHPDDRARLDAVVTKALRAGKSIDYEWRAIRPNGETRHIFGRNVVIADGSGRPVRMAGTSIDITDRKLADENQRTLLLELQKALAEVKTLEGILPICASCKRIRAENDGWQPVELYVREHTNAEFSHGLCPDCAARDWG